jgi:hypothetical protein
MDRGIKLACSAVLLGATLALGACSSAGDGAVTQFPSCKGGYRDCGGIRGMSPHSPNAGTFQPDSEGRG